MELLTHSRLRLLRTCPWAHYLRFELKLRRKKADAPLRMGSAYHAGIEHWATHRDPAGAISHACRDYDNRPDWADPADWEVERETVANLLAGRFWRYGSDTLQILAPEVEWKMPLVNPETGKASDRYMLAGKIDAIGMHDGRVVVVEYKTAGEDINVEAEYWSRLRLDPQISIYVLALRWLFDCGAMEGIAEPQPVNTIIYDATRKPTISPRQIPVLDENGCKIVLDQAGQRVMNKTGSPRQSASTENGWVLQTTVESPEQFGERLLADIGERPDFYFGRREVPRLEDDLLLCQYELWQQAEELTERTRAGRWFRNASRTTCSNCEFKQLCFNNIPVNPEGAPAGYEVMADAFPELTERAES